MFNLLKPNTLKTTAGYLVTLVSRYTPLKFQKNHLEGIYNYLPISDRLCTSGQPSENQFELIRAAGFNTVINLAPHHVENALPDEAGLLQSLGMTYWHIPVNFQNPTEENFQQFVDVMEQTRDQQVWLHCAANMRASAFLYRYRRDVLKEDTTIARQTMNRIWEPFGVWQDFIK
ncbi:MAG: protein tyrosine phosphatase family protein [Ketobacteraceae bacterium]|nr:protein tyrosine phosphatase family protein [Ketobacteraceae bacterium]